MAHPWHDIALPEDMATFPAVIEVPQGSKNKYELDKETGLLRLDRVLFSAMRYPANYGFIPRTLAEDGDALDVLVLSQEPVAPLAFLFVRAIGGFRMRDEKGIDDKIICVHINDPFFSDYHDSADLPSHVMLEIMRFFEDYKELEHKISEVKAPTSRAEALKIIDASVKAYRQHFTASSAKS